MGGLGFRDMHTFNLAMLSRQGWRIIQQPDNLCARILKARYFPSGSALDAVAHDGISYAWRSILQGIDVVKQGYIWRVGDGTNINIWRDPWIPRPWSRRVITPRGASLLTHVNELLCPITGAWDEQLIRETFCAEDARYILQIPVREGVQDFFAWHFDPKGVHSVRSAYKLLAQIKKQQRNGAPGTSTESEGRLDGCSDQSWKRIWRLPCPAKLQMFVWRLRHESLALCANLKRRGMQLESMACFVCGRGEEDGGHLFIKCKAVKEAWRQLGLEQERRQLETIGDVHAMLDSLWGLAEKKRVLIITFWWHWWNNRNRIREGDPSAQPSEIVR